MLCVEFILPVSGKIVLGVILPEIKRKLKALKIND